jgi:lipopolysaccharide/colanic/teichoic acid biosynthesis glycosyltransferase
LTNYRSSSTRPHAAAHNSEHEKLIGNYAFRKHVKPGITGWAQMNGYWGETPTTELMAKRIELNLGTSTTGHLGWMLKFLFDHYFLVCRIVAIDIVFR